MHLLLQSWHVHDFKLSVVPAYAQTVKNGDMLVLDAMNNKIIINPSDAELAEAKKIKSDFEAEAAELAKLKNLPAITLDNHQVEVCGNIGTVKDAVTVSCATVAKVLNAVPC